MYITIVTELAQTNKRYEVQRLQWSFYLLLMAATANASILDWFWSGSLKDADSRPKIGDVSVVKIPFEVTSEDEKFLQDAKKYTSLKLSDLDSCQHHLVMKIRNSCSDITEEELAKMSVNLLNCQSAVEGRQQFPCTSKMSLRDCTGAMDSDMWNTYHLMNNRARAVCYAARHQQFRALSEMTVNKLMDSAHNQLNTMNSLKEGQEKLESLTTKTMESVSVGHQSLLTEQEKLRVLQHNIQDSVVLNLRELSREKLLIAAGHHELARLTEDVKKKLGQTRLDLESQVIEHRENHKKLLDDLDNIQEQMSVIWDRIDHSTQTILAHHASVATQYESTLTKMAQINATVNFLLDLLDKAKHELDVRMHWLNTLLGGNTNEPDRLWTCAFHVLYLIVGMIVASFLRAPTLTRVVLLVIVPLNFGIAYQHGESAALNFPSMTLFILLSTTVHWLNLVVLNIWRPKQSASKDLHNSQSQSMKYEPVSLSSPEKSVTVLHSLMGNVDKLRFRTGKALQNLISLVGNWTSKSAKVSAENGHIRNDVKDSDNESSCNDEVEPQDLFSEDLTYSNYGSSDFLRVHSGTPSSRQHYTSPLRIRSPSSLSQSSSRSGTPRPVLHRSICRAICRNGQPCRNSASTHGDVCRIHANDSPSY